MLSATAVVKAITSCLTSFSICRMRAVSKLAYARSACAASGGTTPISASASEAASSTSSHCRNLFSSVQMRPISGRVYLAIKAINLRGAGLAGDFERRGKAAALERLRSDQAHDLRMIVVLAEVPEQQPRRRAVEIAQQKVAHGVVGKMADAAHHALLDRPGIGADLQHFQIVIGFKQHQIG